MAQLQWSGAADWLAVNRTIWRSDPHDPFAVVGYVRQSSDRRLTLVSIPDAGHMAIMDQPRVTQQMMLLFAANASFPVGTGFPPGVEKRSRRALRRQPH